MSLEVKLMLEKVHGVFSREIEDPQKAWDRLIEFIAVDHNASVLQQLDHKFDWLLGNRGFSEDVAKVYEPVLLRASQDDDLGELYREKFAVREAHGRKTKPSQLEIAVTTDNRRPVILDPAVSTGQRIMSTHRKMPKALFFGADPDLRALRIASTNAAIHDIPGHFLVADYRIHDLDLRRENGRLNWQQANRWYGPTSRLRPLPRTDCRPSRQAGEAKGKPGGVADGK